MQTINNRTRCHRSHLPYHHTRKPAIRHNKRCTFATTATVTETSIGHSSSTTDITGN